jgi:hypothetical protein
MGFRRDFTSRVSRGRTERFQARQSASQQRNIRLSGAAQQFLDPTLSGVQGQQVQNVGRTAAIQGLLGGAVDVATERTRTQFLAGNRLGGLQGLVDDFLGTGRGSSNFASTGGSRGEGILGVLAQITGLQAQFLGGGFPGVQTVADLNPGDVGAFLGRRQSQQLALPSRRGGIGAQQVALGTPGTGENELARRLAESQGVVDTTAFIRQNPQLQTSIRRAQIQGLNVPQSRFAQDFFGGQVADTDLGEDFQNVISGEIRRQNFAPRFGIRSSLFPEGLRGLAESGLLPFSTRAGATLPSAAARNPQAVSDAAADFAPLLFGSGA